MQFRILGLVASLVALILSLSWFGWKFALVIWLAGWGNNLTMAAKLGYRNETDDELSLSDDFHESEQV